MTRLESRLDAASEPGFRPDTVCDNFIAGGDPMPTPARGKAPLIETLSLEERVRRRAYVRSARQRVRFGGR